MLPFCLSSFNFEMSGSILASSFCIYLLILLPENNSISFIFIISLILFILSIILFAKHHYFQIICFLSCFPEATCRCRHFFNLILLLSFLFSDIFQLFFSHLVNFILSHDLEIFAAFEISYLFFTFFCHLFCFFNSALCVFFSFFKLIVFYFIINFHYFFPEFISFFL